MISDHYEPKEELPEDAAERLLGPPLEKGDTYRNMDSVAITNQITERDGLNSISMRSDRNEDTLRPMAGGNDEEKGLKLEDFGAEKSKVKYDEVFDNYMNQFRKEVDFHHKIAYRFEKAYRLGKKSDGKK